MRSDLADVAAAFRGARVLVTGGAGFIGSGLCARLVALGAEVAILDNMYEEGGANPQNLASLAGRVRVERRDLTRPGALAALLEGCGYVFALAGHSSHMGSIAEPIADLDINCRAQLLLLEECRRRAPGAAIVFASTRQIYGRPDRLPVDESHPLRPPDPNAVSKMAGEAYHLLYHRIHGLGTVALRLTNTYGPRMRIKDANQTFLGVWLRAVLEGRPFEVWGGEQRRDLAYVDDVVEAFLLAAATPAARGRVFNVGGERTVTLLELARLVIAAAGRGEFRVKPYPEERKPIDIGDYAADDSAFRGVTGWRPAVALPDGLARTLDYFRDRLQAYL
ncbi:MAG TPA: NAD-dependent epimerase/dehydratase family protein [Stellaceae bacterium]|nr:NAD-dependent epimerase/dehydratase family protein [Stellaceae bacterium]